MEQLDRNPRELEAEEYRSSIEHLSDKELDTLLRELVSERDRVGGDSLVTPEEKARLFMRIGTIYNVRNSYRRRYPR